ncbi:MAG: hypothetical protein IJ666_01420 [Ruminococcus sp.]|nr:hypothetical protein [Ruminococcus sp.]
MPEDVNITSRTAAPITVGDIDFYCESMKVSAVNLFYEQPTVSGGTVVSNEYTKASRLTFSGRICGDTRFETMADLNNMMKSVSDFSVSYMGIIIGGCRLQSFTFSDNGLDYAEISLTLVTYQDMTQEEKEEE